MKHLKSSLLFTSGFAGGLLAGWVISSYNKPDSFRNHKERMELAITRVNRAVREGTERIREINDRLKHEFSHPIPDLYKATELLSLDENELIYD